MSRLPSGFRLMADDLEASAANLRRFSDDLENAADDVAVSMALAGLSTTLSGAVVRFGALRDSIVESAAPEHRWMYDGGGT